MPPVNAISLTSTTNDWLANTQRPVILHIFDHACNLLNEHQEVLSIVTPQIGNGPFNLVVAKNLCFTQHINLESPISTSATQLRIGVLTIRIKDTQLWNPHPNWEILRTEREHSTHQVERLRMTNDRKGDDSGVFYLTPQSPVSNLQFSNSLSSSLATANLPSSIIAARKLAGLGQGLTPAGDDYMIGALYAAWIIHPSKVVLPLAKAIANTAAALTTSLSAAWLRSAGRGEAGILWHDFLYALAGGEPDQIQSTMDKIMATGATSGADALAGFINTCISYTELKKKHVISKFL